MNEFIKHYDLVISTLSPVHIGCGEDYEPTNYIIQDGALYYFEPSSADLPKAERDALLKMVESDTISLATLRSFFKDRGKYFLPYTQRIVPVTPEVEASYLKSFTDQQARGDAKIEIDRTYYNPLDGQPIIPGSSIKGAIRTAVLDGLNAGRGSSKQHASMQHELMGGSFNTDPMRLFKVSDARHLASNQIGSKIMFAVSRRKKAKIVDGKPDDNGKGIPTYKECLPACQRHVFSLTLGILDTIPQSPDKQPRPEKVILKDFNRLAEVCNSFYRPLLMKEIELLLGRGFINKNWAETLLRELQNGVLSRKLADGKACLLRLGRHSGAVAMTLNGLRSIKIMQGKGMSPLYEDDTRQIWMAADKKNATRDMLPFGWVLIERAGSEPIEGLKTFFDNVTQWDDAWLESRHSQIEKWREEVIFRRTQLAEKNARDAAEDAAEQARKEQLDALSPNRKRVEMFIDEFRIKAEQLRGKLDRQYTDYHERARKLAKDALEGADWTAEEKHAAADAIAEWLPKVVERIDKDQLKKLKLAALRGQA